MNRVLPFNIADITPDGEAVLRSQGVAKGAKVGEGIHRLLAEAFDRFAASARPQGLIAELPTSEFETIFAGEGDNAANAPLEEIFPQATRLALFALTMGNKVSDMISRLFADSDFALGVMLDSMASLAADRALEVLEITFADALMNTSHLTRDACVLSYSPGYCGWHISGQKKLFDYLRPEKIGISLNESFLMSPLKSVTGVLVAGKKDIHIFDPHFPFCRLCKTYSCRPRMKKILMR